MKIMINFVNAIMLAFFGFPYYFKKKNKYKSMIGIYVKFSLT